MECASCLLSWMSKCISWRLKSYFGKLLYLALLRPLEIYRIWKRRKNYVVFWLCVIFAPADSTDFFFYTVRIYPNIYSSLEISCYMLREETELWVIRLKWILNIMWLKNYYLNYYIEIIKLFIILLFSRRITTSIIVGLSIK